MKILERLNGTLHSIRQIMHAKKVVPNELKFSLLGYITASIHVVFLLCFLLNRCYFLAGYNVFAIILYLYGAVGWTRRNEYESFYYASACEIIIHSIMATIFLGWNMGFMTYTLAVIPMAYYYGYTVKEIQDRIFVPVFISLMEAGCYLGVFALCEWKSSYPAVLRFNELVLFLLKYFNHIIALALFIVLSMLFSLEIRYMQSQLEGEKNKLVSDAGHDSLTGLMNRRGFKDVLDQARIDADRYNRSFGLALCDIDHFKGFNDTYGHDCGDEVLVSIAKTISGSIREKDGVCRWGGEEILVVLVGKEEEIRRVAERIRKNVEDMNFSYDGNDVKITITIGLSFCSGASGDVKPAIHEMIEEADVNLYYGKQHGRNCVV